MSLWPFRAACAKAGVLWVRNEKRGHTRVSVRRRQGPVLLRDLDLAVMVARGGPRREIIADASPCSAASMFARMAVQNSTASSDRLTERICGVPTKRARSKQTHQVKDVHSARMDENGTFSYPQSIDSRQSGRPHDQGHESRETDQVWTCSELARIILHRLGPT